MRTLIILAATALAIGACSYRSETVERQTPSGRTVVTSNTTVAPPTIVVPD